MIAASSPQHMAVGEPNTSSNPEATYAAPLNSVQTGQNLKTTKLKSIDIIHGEPTITFTVEEINQYTMEEGLHQALVFKFSQDPINMQEVRKLLPIQLGTQAKTVQYLSYNGLQKQFRVFPWTIGFNPKEETSRAFVWISFPNLPPELFAKQSLLSIASAAGKPIAIDKATQDKSRPSTARVKVEIDLLANLPHRMRIQYVDQKTGKSVEQFQKFVYDNLSFYCNFCKHQGHNESDCRLLLGNTAARNQEEASQVGSEIEKYQGDAREILDEKRAENKSLVVDKSGVHDQVVVARDLECQNKENFGQLLGKAVAHESASGDQSLTTRNTLVLESQVDFGQQSNSNTVENKSVSGVRLGVKNTREISINNEGPKQPSTIVASTMDDGDQLNGTRGDVVLIGKSGHPLATNTTVDLALDPVNAKVVADGPQHDARGVETIECLVDNMTQQVNNANKKIESDVETNSIALMNAKSTVISKEKQGATSTLRWIDIADKEEEQVTSPPMQKKLIPTAPAFVPSSAKLVTPPQGLSPSTNVAAILSDVCCTLSPNKFANLDDEDISEEGEEGEEEEMLDCCFAIATRNADISPRQQRNNNTKHERKHSWDGKVTEEFVPRQLPM
ncbi:hypothetical protein KY290_019577 [Solanum tuberosum]|uniref:DUF4283 domain-containing protein n=1 Tax=Solanum tuberosum TaxID=4113 RepID=A0ABQ7VHG8_SOLTU|nr:hypothetical protein KY284_018467 [Solanum tuberosum]KAH0763504.1 hypothetical protein KY290_019577 [Solanum tuberosum]